MRLCSLSTYRKKSSFREGAGLTFNKIIYVGKNLKKSKLYQKKYFLRTDRDRSCILYAFHNNYTEIIKSYMCIISFKYTEAFCRLLTITKH